LPAVRLPSTPATLACGAPPIRPVSFFCIYSLTSAIVAAITVVDSGFVVDLGAYSAPN